MLIKAFKLLIVNLFVLFLLLVAIEGISWLILFNKGIENSKGLVVAERHHTRYDPELGWISVPNTQIPDFYGAGKEIMVNGQGFRGDYDFSAKVPEKKVRIICSGDSFTLGYGVSNQSTWVNLLRSYNKSIETVNMGQGGYGLDQMYLWYIRDGVKLDHDIHLFAFIGEDFRRMLSDNLLGFGKPLLKIENGNLVTINTPVPKSSYIFSWITRNMTRIGQLASVRLLSDVVQKSRNDLKVDNKEQVVETIFAKLDGINRQKGSTFVLVWLPDSNNAVFDDIRNGIMQLSQKNCWYFIDLSPEVDHLGTEKYKLFFPYDGKHVGAGHYSEEGNRVIAKALYRKLETIPEVSRKIHKFNGE